MTELERTLVLLGEELAYPAAPDVSARVLRRIEEEPPPRRRPGRRSLVLAFALLVAVAAAMAVPQARTAILEFFGLRGATVQRVETLPQVPPRSEAALGLGRPVRLEDLPAPLVPSALGPPDAVYRTQESWGSKLTFVYEPRDGVPRSSYTGVGILVSQFSGSVDQGFVDKLVDSGARVESLRVGGEPALWIAGGPHFVFFRTPEGPPAEDEGRLAGNTLLVERGDTLVRIEGELSRARAIEIAESLAAG